MNTHATAHSHTAASTPRTRRAVLATVAALAATVLPLATPTAAAARPTERGTAAVQTAFSVARHQTGTPYTWGGTSPRRGFDCSGLTQFAYRKARIALPRTSRSQARVATRIPRRQLRRGDLMFFPSRTGRIYHVGLYAGRTGGKPRILHAPATGGKVRTEKVWTSRWYGATVRR